MADEIYYPHPEIAKNAYCNSMEQYRKMHEKWVILFEWDKSMA